MIDALGYQYEKSGKLRKAFSFACKKKDVDSFIQDEGKAIPFHHLTLSGYGNDSFWREFPAGCRRIRAADGWSFFRPAAEETVRWLTINAVPRDVAYEVRQRMREEGLKRLVSWLQKCSEMPPVRQTFNIDWMFGFLKRTTNWITSIGTITRIASWRCRAILEARV